MVLCYVSRWKCILNLSNFPLKSDNLANKSFFTQTIKNR